MSQPFITWIASYPRSGNTWIRALLLAHRFGDKFNLNNMDAIPGECSPGFYKAVWPGGEYDRDDWVCMRPLALRLAYETRRHKDFIIKTHTANIRVNNYPLIPHSYTNKAIYIARDPRDVLCSCARYFNKTHQEMIDLMENDGHTLTDDKSGALQFVSSYMKHISGWVKEKSFPVHVVTYSNLLCDTGAELIGILRFLDPDAKIDVDRVALAVSLSSKEKLQAAEEKDGFRERPPGVKSFFGGSSSWKDELSQEMVKRIEQW